MDIDKNKSTPYSKEIIVLRFSNCTIFDNENVV